MRLKLLLPTTVLIDREVGKVVAEAENGSFGLLPHHIDFVAALVPGILIYADAEGAERFVGIDQGLLVKCADEVLVSTHSAIEGEDLDALRREVHKRYLELDEIEKSARSALARLEAGVVRRFVELRKQM